MSQPKVAIDITANDRTAKGARSAEKRLGTVPKHVSAVTRNQDRAMREGLGRSSRSALRTLGQVEQASARVFGGRSVTSGFATRLGAIREAAAATGTGLGEAAGSGRLLLPRHSRARFVEMVEWMALDDGRWEQLPSVLHATSLFRQRTQLADWGADERVQARARELSGSRRSSASRAASGC